MKNKIAISAITSGLFLSAGPTFAFDTGNTYVGAQYAMLTYSESDFPDYDLTALVIRGGYFFNKYFSIEGRLGFGIGDDSKTVFDPTLGTFDLKLELDNMFGVYGVGHIPVSERVDLYGLIGLTNGESTASATIPGFGSVSVSDDESDLSLGVGADFLVTKNFSLNIEYTSYLSKSDFDADAISLGANYYF